MAFFGLGEIVGILQHRMPSAAHLGSMLYLRSIDPLELTRERLELQYWKSLYKHVTTDVAQGKYGDLVSLRTSVCNDEGLSDLNLSMDVLKVAAVSLLASIFLDAMLASVYLVDLFPGASVFSGTCGSASLCHTQVCYPCMGLCILPQAWTSGCIVHPVCQCNGS